jgi:hypothetical protein
MEKLCGFRTHRRFRWLEIEQDVMAYLEIVSASMPGTLVSPTPSP